ncbi:helicase-like transcription factor [Haliotis asinina]|uniref:helicase-like transcription factor n=1 Tax=Haliotis asinina TaxID=109174 RepID=UPI003531A43D
MNNLPAYFSLNDIAWMRQLARDDSPSSHDDSQEVHASDVEEMLETLTGTFEKSSQCPWINSHELVLLEYENVPWRRKRVVIFNSSKKFLGTLNPPLDDPMMSIKADDVARVEAETLVLNESSKTVPIQVRLYGPTFYRDKCTQILNAAFNNGPNNEAAAPHSASAAGPIVTPITGLKAHPDTNVDSHRQKLAPVEVGNVIDQLFETLDEGDKNTEQEPTEAVRTPLYKHQKQALHWMISRENKYHLPPFWEITDSGRYYNKLLNHTEYERPPGVPGGILADDMGLGKTLEIISLVLTNFVDNRPLAVPLPDTEGSRREKFLNQMEEKHLTKTTRCLPKLRFGKPDIANIETVTSDTDRRRGHSEGVDRMDDIDASDADKSWRCSEGFARSGVTSDTTQKVELKGKHTSIYDDDELPDLCDETLCDDGSGEEDPDVMIVGVSSNTDKSRGCCESSGNMNDEDMDTSDLMAVSHCDEMEWSLSINDQPRGTLIICPLCVLNNWQDQFIEHVHPNVHVDVYRYHGNQRCRESSFLERKDVVLTTYGVVRSEFKNYLNQKEAPLFTMSWLRIVLDEGHTIRNPRAQQTKAVIALRAQRKWVLSGTPIQNRMLDLWPLISFLNVTPLHERHWWDCLLENPLQRGQNITFRRVQHLMGNIALRRTKNTLVDGEPLVKLPKREIYMERIKMSDEESRKYKSMEEQGKIKIKNYIRNNILVKKYCFVLVILLRLRQMCCHRYLLPANSDWMSSEESDSEKEDFAVQRETLVNMLKDISESEEECSVCVDVLKTPVILPCAHYFCHGCILKYIKHMEEADKGDATCPMCRVPIAADRIIQLPEQPEPQQYGDWKSSTKVDALITAVVKLRREDPSVKSIVASQFRSFLTLIEKPLEEHKFKVVRLDGKMSSSQRQEAIKKFSDPEPGSPTICLLSIRAGGLGLNLIAASRVFLMDPQWNPAVEEQCFDRCHRLGQTRDVIITKFICEDTIEERMLDLQERKRLMTQQVFRPRLTAAQGREQWARDVTTVMKIE